MNTMNISKMNKAHKAMSSDEMTQLLADADRMADSAKKQSLLIIARTALFNSDSGEVITEVDIAKADSMMSMRETYSALGHNLGFFHGLGFLVATSSNTKPCCADVARELKAGTNIRLDAKVFSEVVGLLAKIVRCTSKELISVEDAGKAIARLVVAIRDCHKCVVIAS